jgi:excisionase family DNA binding protein
VAGAAVMPAVLDRDRAMNPLQHWYEYVESVSRPLRRRYPDPEPPPELPESAHASPLDLPLPRPHAGDRSREDPRLRARRFLATLIPLVRLDSEPVYLPGDPSEEPVPELAFSPAPVEMPHFAAYVSDSPEALPPWAGDAGAWVREVAHRVTDHEENAARCEEPQSPVAEPEPDEAAAEAPAETMNPPVACTGLRVTRCEATHSEEYASTAESFDPADRAECAEREKSPAARPAPRAELLLGPGEDEITQNSYKVPFRETRHDMVQRLLDPPLTLEEVARLLQVCPTTVRRYTNRGLLRHYRTPGNQRRFRLSDVLEFLEARSGAAGADRARAPFGLPQQLSAHAAG